MFYYANASGSRVYFDDLGPPWPKHPCTDNPRRPIPLLPIQGSQLTRRKKGEVKELLSAASTAGLASYRPFGQRYEGEWTLVVIVSVNRHGQENIVEGEFLDSETNELFRFICYSEMPLFEVGDFISVNGIQISFVDRAALVPVVFMAGSWVTPDSAHPAPERSTPTLRPVIQRVNKSKSAELIHKHPKQLPTPNQFAPILPPAPKQINKPLLRKISRRKLEQNNATGFKQDLTEAEMVHFDNRKISFANLFSTLEPVVKTYAREGTRKPRDVALRLNAQGYKTASGAKWTPRFAYFLLKLTFNKTSTQPVHRELAMHEKVTAFTKEVKVHKKLSPPQNALLTNDEMRRRLEALQQYWAK